MGSRVLEIEFTLGAVPEQDAGDIHGTLLVPDIFARGTQALFEGAMGEVGVRNFRAQDDREILVVGDRGEIARVGGLDAASELAPEVDFPA